jgi:hypothetical protein
VKEKEPGKEKPGARKPYVKPAVEQVKLRPDEAVLGACKVSSGIGPTGFCAVTCSTAGS